MDSRKIMDILVIVIAFGIYIIILNIDENIDKVNLLSKHIWITIVLSYFTGRCVSLCKNSNIIRKKNLPPGNK